MSEKRKTKTFTLLASAALAAGLSAPSAASAFAGTFPDMSCEQTLRRYCLWNWAADGWSTPQECFDELVYWSCYFDGSNPGFSALKPEGFDSAAL